MEYIRNRIAIHTLGCKVNQCDTEKLLARLIEEGYDICSFDQTADVYIINTCTVTHTGDKKSLQIIRRARRLNPTAFIAVCGCMPNGQADNINKITASGADFVFDTRKPYELIEKLEATFSNQRFMTARSEEQSPAIHLNTPTDLLKTRHRAFIKIQDGCDRYCAYCIVPYVRGPVVSRSPSDILTEAKSYIQGGVKEIVLTGIQVAAYGYDTGSEFVTLPKLINKLAVHNLRLRLSSIDPWAIDDAFLSAIDDSPTLCSHFHLSLQSGSDKTLACMNRRYTIKDYSKAAEKLRALRPNMALTTDIIVGFPGETNDDFRKSIHFVEKMGFAQIHVFEYSQRTGTQAANFPEQIPSQIKSTRGKEMRALASDLQQKFLYSQTNTTTTVLFETQTTDTPETWQGYSDNYCLVEVQGTNLANTIRDVHIIDIANDKLIGCLTL